MCSFGVCSHRERFSAAGRPGSEMGNCRGQRAVQSHIPFTHTFALLGCCPDDFLSHLWARGKLCGQRGAFFISWSVCHLDSLLFTFILLSAKMEKHIWAFQRAAGIPKASFSANMLACHSQGPAAPCLTKAILLSLGHAEQKAKKPKSLGVAQGVCDSILHCCRVSLASFCSFLSSTHSSGPIDSRETEFRDVRRCFGMHIDTPRLPQGQIPSAYVHEATSASSQFVLTVAVSPGLLSLPEEFQLQDTIGSSFTCSHWTLTPGCWC